MSPYSGDLQSRRSPADYFWPPSSGAWSGRPAQAPGAVLAPHPLRHRLQTLTGAEDKVRDGVEVPRSAYIHYLFKVGIYILIILHIWPFGIIIQGKYH